MYTYIQIHIYTHACVCNVYIWYLIMDKILSCKLKLFWKYTSKISTSFQWEKFRYDISSQTRMCLIWGTRYILLCSGTVGLIGRASTKMWWGNIRLVHGKTNGLISPCFGSSLSSPKCFDFFLFSAKYDRGCCKDSWFPSSLWKYSGRKKKSVNMLDRKYSSMTSAYWIRKVYTRHICHKWSNHIKNGQWNLYFMGLPRCKTLGNWISLILMFQAVQQLKS